LEAVDREGRHSSEKEFAPDRFRSAVEEHFKEWLAEEEITEAHSAEFASELKEQVLDRADDGEDEARRVLNEFSHEIDGKKLQFHDTWEWSFSQYTYRFTWCCLALVWAIKQFDQKKAA
jgi:hypothetical protein